MGSFVLIHGGNMSVETWNRLALQTISTSDGLMGGRIWDTITPALTALHHQVFAPTLGDEHQNNLTGHIRQVSDLIREHDLSGIILAGHSYGGIVITGVAAEMPERIRQLIYVDAAVPDPGESLFDILQSAGLDPVIYAGEAAPPYIEQIRFDPGRISHIPKMYIRCTLSDFSPVTRIMRDKISRSDSGWTYFELPSSHVPMASMPGELTRLILKHLS